MNTTNMSEGKALMSDSLPNSSGTAAAAAADSSTHNDVSSSLHRRRDPSDITTTGPLDEEVAHSSPTPFDDFEHNLLKLQSPCRQLFAAADDSSTHNDKQPTPQDRPEDDVSNDVFTTSPLDDDGRVNLCEEGCSSPPAPSDKDNAVVCEEVLSPAHIGDNDDKDTFYKSSLPEDTFSFLLYSNVPSGPFFCAIIVFLLQIAIYAIIASNIIDLSNEKNPVNFPPDVDVPVRISEALAIAIAIMTQDDVRKALVLLREQFYQKGLSSDKNDLPKAFPGATITKWILSIILRATEGLFGLSITFLLIMRSSTVLDLLLNFLAVEFVTLLDDVVFALAKQGFLGAVLKKETKNVSDTAYYVNHQSSKAAPYYTVAYFVVLPLIMFAGWGIIWRHQTSGKYLCGELLVQFGDEVQPMLGTFSGLYFSQRKLSFGNRLSYVPKDDRDGGPLLAYCEEEKRWTLSLTNDDAPNPCNWYAASDESVDFDILTTASSQWFVHTAKNRTVPLSQHFLACYDCTDNMCGPNGKCNDKGECECEPGHIGLRCEYPDPCQTLEIDPRDKGFLKEGGGSFASKYYRLKDVETYNHPVYTSLRDNQTLSDETDIILFTGVRWVLSYKYLFPGLKDVNDTERLAWYFHTQFHGHFTNYIASYVSEPVYTDTPLDATASPLSVRWRYSGLDKDQRLRPDLQKDFIEASFFCAVCNKNTNPCSYGGVCLSNGTCGGCPNDSSGSMCQIPPVSNGQCNPYFNNITFGFDGGDCCENTCRSTPENACGKAGQGYIDTGYPSCTSASDQWELSGDPIYGVSSLSTSRSGLAIALSGKGKVLAVADPGVSIVRLFDKEGSNWIVRGQVQGPPESNFGLAIDLSDESYNITRNPSTSPTVTLAVGAPKDGLVRVYTCSTNGCMQRGDDINGTGTFGSSLSIAKDGNSIAIGGADPDRADMDETEEMIGVKVFIWSSGTNDWQQQGNATTIATPWSRKLAIRYIRLQGYYVSLSSDYLAVGTLKGEESTVASRISELVVQVYKWDESTGWEILGGEINKDFDVSESPNDASYMASFHADASFSFISPLKSIVIKGSKLTVPILAIGSTSSVDVYEWNETSSKWIPREIQLQSTDAIGFVGWSLDLSEDANTLAVGTRVANPQTMDESIRMYEWDGTRYTALFNGVPGGPFASLSLSSDGTAVAVGLPFDAWKGGSTRVYSFHPSSSCEDPSEIPLRISFTTDGRPDESRWELRVDSEVKRRSGSLSGYMETTFVEEMCVPATSCVKFIVYDSKGDGLKPPGVFSLMLDGKEEARGGDFDNFFYVKSLGDCDCLEDEVPFSLTLRSDAGYYSAEWSLLEHNTASRTGGVGEDFLLVDECIPVGCYDLLLKPSQGDPEYDFCESIDLPWNIFYEATYNGGSIVSKSISGEFCTTSYKFGECPTTSSP